MSPLLSSFPLSVEMSSRSRKNAATFPSTSDPLVKNLGSLY